STTEEGPTPVSSSASDLPFALLRAFSAKDRPAPSATNPRRDARPPSPCCGCETTPCHQLVMGITWIAVDRCLRVKRLTHPAGKLPAEKTGTQPSDLNET